MKNIFSFLKKDKKTEERTCPKWKAQVSLESLYENLMICPECGAYLRMGALERIELVVDSDTFVEVDGTLEGSDPIAFPGYGEKLQEAREKSNLLEAVICGAAEINGSKCAIFAMDSNFMMGSMGCAVGEKLTRLFEKATEEKLPVVGFITSGGARMQEGILSLMQMAKVSGAVRRHSDGGNLYVAVLTDPTTGGVTASFAMLGDIIIAEPGALIGFAGQRVIKQTTGEELPKGFQRAEFMLEHGFIDIVEERQRLKYTISNILKMHETQDSVSNL